MIMLIKVTEDNFEEEVLKSDKRVVVDFNADWCGPCRMLAPVVEQLSNEHPEVKFASVNVDDCGEKAAEYGINSIPCLIAFEKGEEIKRSLGFKPKAALLTLLV